MCNMLWTPAVSWVLSFMIEVLSPHPSTPHEQQTCLLNSHTKIPTIFQPKIMLHFKLFRCMIGCDAIYNRPIGNVPRFNRECRAYHLLGILGSLPYISPYHCNHSTMDTMSLSCWINLVDLCAFEPYISHKLMISAIAKATVTYAPSFAPFCLNPLEWGQVTW